jgi:hypothetical protein
MRHPNLSAELNDLIEKGEDRDLSLKLRNLKPEDVIMIAFRDDQSYSAIMFAQVTKPAGPGMGKDSLEGELIDSIFPKEWLMEFARKGINVPPFGVKCSIAGSCTKNPDAPMGLTMLHFHTITADRQLLWYLGRDDLAWLFWDTVSAKSVIRKDDIPEMMVYARDVLGLKILSDKAHEEIRKKAQLANQEAEEWEKYIKQALQVRTRNSVYVLGKEDENGKRTLQKKPDGEVKVGKLVFLREGKSMRFVFDNSDYIDTSTVLEIEPI